MPDGNTTGRVSGQQHCLDDAFTCGLGARCKYDWKISFGIAVEHHCLDASFPCRLEGRWPKSNLNIIDMGRWIARPARHLRQVRKDSHGTRTSVAMFPTKIMFYKVDFICLNQSRASRKGSCSLSMLHLCLQANLHDSPTLAFWLGFGHQNAANFDINLYSYFVHRGNEFLMYSSFDKHVSVERLHGVLT